ncbi:ATP-binding protein [Vibrio fluvialis]|jgi:predicted ATP-binding protein involved in virulence|uniref:AAA family ATPase n=1 Tax=Vibrio fluvialis TaxID=676 RepID=UPI001C9CB009|nr:AAA family ATPase [Vibrio fluvialis]ELS3714172.1 ATP-binding protein [Vibrio fluvialis]ELX9690873.1 ATP-binding protein [Vibrio fluvialis]EMC0409826.1 ATP-binding protein [Vibrio fluvialis]MBY7812857.1 ATP-binding protein [Vibrio fluvialis]MBY7931107.1 ATP-binding protein [Vibrio fluvialis]
MKRKNELIENDNTGIYLLTGDNGTGKTRYLSELSENEAQKIISGESKFKKMICLSGTVYEKFPKPNKNNKINIDNKYYYFGYKSNNNMFSEITPFRMVVSVMLNGELVSERASYAASLLEEIGFSEKIKFDFRWARGNKGNESDKLQAIELDLLDENTWDNGFYSFKQLLDEERAHLNKIYFCKGSEEFPVTALSSGERLFLLIILALCFSTDDNSLILFDEPENSMHPKWQEKVTQVICNIFSKFALESKLIIATHSPLVVSSVPNTSSKISDLNVNGVQWSESRFNGNNADSILKEHFGLISARSTEFVLAFQACLSSMANKQDNFIECFQTLKSLNVSLSREDPLYDAYCTLVEFAGEQE